MCLDDGPDIVEAVMDVEERFGIVLPDDEAEKIATMGQLYDFVHARVARGQPQVCVTSAGFYRLRGAVGEVCGVPRERVRPDVRLEDFPPLPDRAGQWQALGTRLGVSPVPPLRRPGRVENRIALASLATLLLSLPLSTILGLTT